MISSRQGVIGAIAVIAIVAGAIWVTGRLTVIVPADAATTVLARSVLSGPITPDTGTGDEVDPSTVPSSPYGQQCLDRIQRAAGWMDLCWEAFRDPYDADPRKDYYRLRIYGSFGGASGSGARWAVVAARLVGATMDGVFETWPDGVYEGACDQVIVDVGPVSAGSPKYETLCGRTMSVTAANASGWSQWVTWTCPDCVFANHDTRSIALYQMVGVAEGTVPTWDIFGDLGG